MQQFRKVTDAYDSVKTGLEPDAPIHLVSLTSLSISLFSIIIIWQYNCPRLKNAVQELALWDEFSMDIAIFPELPRPLIAVCTSRSPWLKPPLTFQIWIQASLIRPQLREIVKLQQIEKLRANEDLMIAVHISRELFEKWYRRLRASPNFYVVLG